MGGNAWHERFPDEYERVRESVAVEFPYLFFSERNGRVVVAGDFPIVVDDEVIDSFEVEITLPKDGPGGICDVRETGGRIPHDKDRHVETTPERIGYACLCVPDEFWFRHPKGLGLLEFLRGPVRSYYISQISFENGNGWPFQERSHGTIGVLEFYKSVCGSDDPVVARAYLEILTLNRVSGHLYCPCGSGKRVRACHIGEVEELRSRIPTTVAQHTLQTFFRYDRPMQRRKSR